MIKDINKAIDKEVDEEIKEVPAEEVITESKVEEPVVEPLAEPVKEVSNEGTVTGCVSLNVRCAPNMDAAILYTIDEGHKVQVDEKESTDEWFHVYTETGAEGFCAKEFISIE